MQKVYVVFGPFAVLPTGPVAQVNGWLRDETGAVTFQNAASNDATPELKFTFEDNNLQMEQKLIQLLIWKFAQATPPVTITEDQMVFVNFNIPTS